VGHDPTAQIGLETTDQQEHAVIKAALDSFFVAVHELAGLAFVVRKPEKNDKHGIRPLVEESSDTSAAWQLSAIGGVGRL
jgi:hypothetical protein